MTIVDAAKWYYDQPDGRGWPHAEAVLAAARRLKAGPLAPEEALAVTLHDIGVGRPGWERDRHPAAALEALERDDRLDPVRRYMKRRIGKAGRRVVEDAILFHMRKSYNVVGIVSPVHKLLIEADEGAPVWGETRIEKPVKYWLSGRGLPLDTPIGDVIAHVLGRLRRKAEDYRRGDPPFTARYRAVFRHEIDRAITWAESVTAKDVMRVITRLRGE